MLITHPSPGPMAAALIPPEAEIRRHLVRVCQEAKLLRRLLLLSRTAENDALVHAAQPLGTSGAIRGTVPHAS